MHWWPFVQALPVTIPASILSWVIYWWDTLSRVIVRGKWPTTFIFWVATSLQGWDAISWPMGAPINSTTRAKWHIERGVEAQHIERYLSYHAANSMMHIQMLISPDRANLVTIKQLLCHYLFDKLCKTLNDATAWIHSPSFWDIQRSYHNLENLAQTVQEVEMLIGDCCGAWWIQVAMILANVKEHFESLTFKLSLYLQLLQNNFNESEDNVFEWTLRSKVKW